MPTSLQRRLLASLAVLLLLCPVLTSRSLEEIKRSGKLYVAFTEWDYRNINYPLALEFARYLNVQLVDVSISWDEAFSLNNRIPKDLETNPDLSYTPDALKKADVICSTFSIVDWRKKLFDLAETLYSSELLISSTVNPLPADYSGLKGKTIAYMKGTTFDAHMEEINREAGGGIILKPLGSEEECKELLLAKKVYGIVLDADEALNFNALHDYQFQIVFPVSPLTRSGWAVEKNSNLRPEIEDFFQTIASNGVLDKIFRDKFHITYSSFLDRIRKTSRLTVYHRDLREIIASGKLVVALRDRNFIYKEGEHKQFMHALAEEFAQSLGVKLEFVITPNSARYWEDSQGKIVKDSAYNPPWFNYFDLACEIFAPADWRSNKVDLVPVFPTEYVVVARKKTNLNAMDELSRFEGVTTRGTVYEDILQKQGIRKFHYTDVDHFLEEVSSGKADYAIIMNAFFELSSYPELEPKFSVGETEICWALRKDEPQLEQRLVQFINESRNNGLIRILDKALRGKEAGSAQDLLNSYYERFQTGQLPFILYGTEDGLPQEDVLSILRDRRGYMWFGTHAGVARYNGREMQVIDSRKGLPGNTVSSIAEDSAGYIYLATNGGLAQLHGDTIIRNMLQGEQVRTVWTDPFSNKWILTDHAVFILDDNGKMKNLSEKEPLLRQPLNAVYWSAVARGWFLAGKEGIFLYRNKPEALTILSHEPCFALCGDVNDSIWISMKEGLFMRTAADLAMGFNSQKSGPLNNRLGIPGLTIKKIVPSRYGSVWLVNDYRIFQALSTDQKATVFEREIGLRNNTILSFLEDREDNLWIGFSGGLQRISNRRGLRNFFPNILNNTIHSIVEDHSGKIWIASNSGIYTYQSELTDLTQLLNPGKGTCLAGKLPDGNIIVAGTQRMLMLNPDNLKVIRRFEFRQNLQGLEKIFISSRGEIFLLTGSRGRIYYFRHPGATPILFENRATIGVYSLTEWDGEIVGGNNSGLISFDGLDFRQKKELGMAVWSLCFYDDKLWIGTENGLRCVENEEVETVSLDAPNLVIKSILPARSKGFLWLGTNRGFVYYNTLSHNTEFTINASDGLPGDEIAADGLFLDQSGILWVGTYHGLSNFNIRAAATRNYTPVCYIERMVLNGTEVSPSARNVFKKNENNLLFEVSALSFEDEQSVEYEFYLRGLENDYSSYSKGKEFRATYTNLPPGKYEFIYNARGKSGIWGYAQKYHFTIRRAWYETWLFRITLAVLLAFLLQLFYKWRTGNFKKKINVLNTGLNESNLMLEKEKQELEILTERMTRQEERIAVFEKQQEENLEFIAHLREEIFSSQRRNLAVFRDHFLLSQSGENAAGDFLWMGDYAGIKIIAVAGNPFPGFRNGLIHFRYSSHLNDIILQGKEKNMQKILQDLNRFSSESEATMEWTYLLFDPEKMNLWFSGNGIFLLRTSTVKKLKTIPPDTEPENQFNPHNNSGIDLQPGDQLYLVTKGFISQSGGQSGLEFGEQNFGNFLCEIGHLPMKQQQQMLEDRIKKWKAGTPQSNNMLVLGLQV